MIAARQAESARRDPADPWTPWASADGWRIGAGAEYAMNDKMFLKLEYRYSNYSEGEVDFEDGDDSGEHADDDADSDSDGVPDVVDTDDNNDGVPDA